MTYTHLPKNLPAILRSHGLKVVEVDGWYGRGRPASTGGFDPVGVLNHHTATRVNSDGMGTIPLLVKGRSDLPGPLCHLSVDREGVVYVVASGRANHAGEARRSGTVAGGDGNTLYIGIEVQNDGIGERWPKAQYDALVLLNAVLNVEVTGNSAQTDRGHKETSVTGKIDPAGPTPYGSTFDMDVFRSHVATKMTELEAAERPKAKPSKSLVGQFKQGGPAWDLSLLDRAVANGRVGLVKDVRDKIVAEAERLEHIKKSPEISAFLNSYHEDRLLRVGLLNNAIKKGRLGTVRGVRDNIRAQIKRLDAVK